MPIIKDVSGVRAIYEETRRRGWVLPCFCSENLTTTEAILSAVKDYGDKVGIEDLPVTVAITCRYDHRSQASYYTHTRNPDLGLELFAADVETLCGSASPFAKLRVLTHLDHIQYDADEKLLNSDLSRFSSIMYDASALPLEENIRRTAGFVSRKKDEIFIEGACDEIFDAGGQAHNEITDPQKAYDYLNRTGVDMIVANLGTEHRASAKSLQYDGEAARKIKALTGERIVLHGTSSVPNTQVRDLFSDGVCKVNIWTALERDSVPRLLSEMVRNAVKVGGPGTVEQLCAEGLLTDKALTGDRSLLTHFTTVYRQDIIFAEMKRLVTEYLEMWYRV